MKNIPDDLRYTASHVWAELLEDGLLKIGITDFAQSELGEVVYVELPEEEHTYTSGEECAVIESVKTASDICCPVSGEIIEINPVLVTVPGKINTDPYGVGWLFTMCPENEEEFADLLDADAYRELIEDTGDEY